MSVVRPYPRAVPAAKPEPGTPQHAAGLAADAGRLKFWAGEPLPGADRLALDDSQRGWLAAAQEFALAAPDVRPVALARDDIVDVLERTVEVLAAHRDRDRTRWSLGERHRMDDLMRRISRLQERITGPTRA